MKISKFKQILISCCTATYHLEAHEEPEDFVVWHQVSEDGLHSDNHRTIDTAMIAVDYFTKKEYPDVPDKLKKAFRSNDIAFRGPEIIYDQTTKRSHYAYTVELVLDGAV